MKIKYNMIERVSIDDFAKEHGLVMRVHEKTNEQLNHAWDNRFYCYFEYLEEKEGDTLVTYSGHGKNPKEAIESYCFEISNTLMVYKAADKKRRKEIHTPMILPIWDEERVK